MCRKSIYLFSSVVLLLGLVGSVRADPNLVAHWTFYDGSTDDISGYGTPANGTLMNDAKVVKDPCRGLVLQVYNNLNRLLGAYPDEPNYMDCGNPAKFNITGQITVAAWIKVDSTPLFVFTEEEAMWAIISKGADGGWYLVGALELGYIFNINDLSGDDDVYNWEDPGAILDGQWHHIAGVYDGENLKLYVDGSGDVEIEGPSSGSIRQTVFPVYVGAGEWLGEAVGAMDGLIDDVRIYKRALSAQEIDDIIAEPIMVAYNAWNANPADGKKSVGPISTTTLSWTRPEPRQGGDILCDVLFGTDPCMVIGPNTTQIETYANVNSTTNFDPLVADANYYWRVDCYDPNGGGEVMTTGRVWSFDTINRVPVVEVGGNQAIILEAGTATAILNGTVTDDGLPEGAAITYAWTKVDGPNEVTFDTNDIEDPCATFVEVGEYVLRLTASDSELDANDTVTISVYDQASLTNGLNYEYFEAGVMWDFLPDFDALTPVAEGEVDNFDINLREQDDSFAFRFTGLINIPEGDDYTFYTDSDDGSKLYIGDTLVVDNDGLHPMQEKSGIIYLDAGQHQITVTFFEKDGGEGLIVSYESPTIAKTVIPDNVLPSGLHYEYFEGVVWNLLPDFDALTPAAEGAVDNFDITWYDEGEQRDYYAFRFTGWIDIPADANYTFYTDSDDGSKLYIGDTLVVSNDGTHGMNEESGIIYLSAGLHHITVGFFEKGGGAGLIVSYESPTISKTVIPYDMLYRLKINSAYDPNPANGATGVARTATLSWSVDYDTFTHDVYLGTNFNDVNDANTTTLDVYKGNISDPCYPVSPPALGLDTKYYWRIDNVDPCTSNRYRGRVWNFTTVTYFIVDDFESYNGSPLSGTWTEAGWAYAYLSVSPNPVHGGTQAIKVEYQNQFPDYYSEVYRTPADPNWTRAGVKALDLWYRGDVTNVAGQPIYVRLHDSDSNDTVTYADPDLQNESWRVWRIALKDFTGVDMTDVTRLVIGIGDGTLPDPPQTDIDIVYFDDIRLYKARCFTEDVPTDLTGDCLTDYRDLNVMVGDWLDGDYTVYATEPDPNRMVVQYKFEEGSGSTAVDSSGNSNDGDISGGAVWDAAGYDGNCLTFDGLNDEVVKLDANNLPTGAGDEWSINMYLYLDVNQEPNSLIGGFGAATGALYAERYLSSGSSDPNEIFFWLGDALEAHQGLASGDAFDVNTGTWQTITVTHDGITTKIWKNGTEIDSDSQTLPAAVAEVRLATAEMGGRFKGKIDEFTIWNVNLTQTEIWYLAGLSEVYYPLTSVANLYDNEPTNFKKINFRDYAILGNEWLKDGLFGN